MFSTLILGASEKPDRYSYLATEMLVHSGYPVYALGTKKGWIGSTEIHLDWPKPGSIDTLTVYINPARLRPMLNDILLLHPRRVIFNPGTEDDALASTLSHAGIHIVEACTLVLLRTNQYEQA
ncbi:MAG: CoA-binding protein [Flavobacteriales bacterium]